VRCFAAAAITTRPTAVLPVKKTWLKRCSSRAVVSGTPPGTTRIASWSRYAGARRTNRSDVAAVTSDGFMTTVLPAATAPAAGTSRSCTG